MRGCCPGRNNTIEGWHLFTGGPEPRGDSLFRDPFQTHTNQFVGIGQAPGSRPSQHLHLGTRRGRAGRAAQREGRARCRQLCLKNSRCWCHAVWASLCSGGGAARHRHTCTHAHGHTLSLTHAPGLSHTHTRARWPRRLTAALPPLTHASHHKNNIFRGSQTRWTAWKRSGPF